MTPTSAIRSMTSYSTGAEGVKVLSTATRGVYEVQMSSMVRNMLYKGIHVGHLSQPITLLNYTYPHHIYFA